MKHQAIYHRVERLWYLHDGHGPVADGDGNLRLFLTAAAAYEWLGSGRQGVAIESEDDQGDGGA